MKQQFEEQLALIFHDLLKILDLFEEYVRKSGKLESFEDRWDYYKETHYTYDYEVDFSDWLEDYCEKGDITDFLYYYYKTNKIPEEVEE